MAKRMSVRLVRALCALVTFAGAASAAEIKVITTGSFKEALGELRPAFEQASGHRLTVIAAGTDEIVRRLGAGETLDIVIAPAPWIEDLIKRGLVRTNSRTDVARSGIGAAVPAGAPRIRIGSSEELKGALLGAESIALSAGVSGIYLNGLFRKWGIAEAIKAKITTLPGAGPVADAVSHGKAAIGFLQVSEWLAVPGITFLGPLPADIQEITTISAGLGRAAAAPEAAGALLKFLQSPEAAAAKRKTGLEPE
jgi:molybdate transport system substrate-binding protein